MRDDWKGDTYDLLDKNCITFCEVFSKALGSETFPSWVSNLHNSASSITTMFPWLRAYFLGPDEESEEDTAMNSAESLSFQKKLSIAQEHQSSEYTSLSLMDETASSHIDGNGTVTTPRKLVPRPEGHE